MLFDAFDNIPRINQLASIRLRNANADSGQECGIFFGKA